MPSSRFTIVITSYNQREFIKEAVDSALTLRHKPEEIIVVDDGSRDGTQETLGKYGDAIRLVCLETNQGHGQAANCGAALATGEYLVFLDGDDAFLPWALDVYERIVQAKKPKLILGNMWWFEGKLPVIQPEGTPHEIRSVEYQDFLRKDRPFTISASALIIDRQSFESVKGWSRKIWPANDMDLTLRLCICGRTIQVLEPPTTLRRMHAANTVHDVASFLGSMQKILHKECAGEYPGGKRRSRERRAFIGARAFYWVRRAAKIGSYWDAIKFLVPGWSMVMAGVTRRLGIALKGRQPSETIKM